MTNHTVLGLFESVNAAADATKTVENLPVSHEDMRVLSSGPYPHGTFFEDHPPTPIWIFTLLGGIGGFLLGLFLGGGTQELMNLNVGNKPNFSLPVMAVICYELTLLGAVIGNITAMFFLQGLPNWNERAYDPEITNGKIGLLVRTEDEALAAKIEKIMKTSGSGKIKRGRGDF